MSDQWFRDPFTGELVVHLGAPSPMMRPQWTEKEEPKKTTEDPLGLDLFRDVVNPPEYLATPHVGDPESGPTGRPRTRPIRLSELDPSASTPPR